MPTDRRIDRSDVLVAAGLTLALLAIYNSNGREIGSFDSQPNKFAARELLLRGTVTLNHVVGGTPEYLNRHAFILSRDGNFRSAYSPVPSILAAGVCWPLWKAGLIDIRAPRGANWIAVIGASLLTALAVSLAFLTARFWLPRGSALVLSAALGLGTGYWYLASQTLWEHETALFGMAIATFAFAAPDPRFSIQRAVWTGIGLSLAGLGRPQLAPMILIVTVGVHVRGGLRAFAVTAAIVAASGLSLMWVFVKWFGSPLGMMAVLEEVSRGDHLNTGPFTLPFVGAAGLLVSPNRGLFVFSPAVLVVLPGIRDAVGAGWRSPFRWCGLAALSQYLVYASFSVWWGGHTYGPRYMLDLLPVVVPLAAAGLLRLKPHRILAVAAVAAAIWSIVVAGTGAFCYPHDEWNTDPVSVNRDHRRLWSWRDQQVVRCWQRGPSPQNFDLFR